MSIFGIEAPKFIYDSGGANEAIVFLDYWNTTKDEPLTRIIENESELDSEADIIVRPTRWEFEGFLHLYKYGLPAPLNYAAIKSKHDEIITYKGSELTLFRHRDGVQFKQTSGADALFVMTEAYTFHLKTPDFKDAMMLKFKSINAVNTKFGVTQTTQSNEIVMDGGTITE